MSILATIVSLLYKNLDFQLFAGIEGVAVGPLGWYWYCFLMYFQIDIEKVHCKEQELAPR